MNKKRRDLLTFMLFVSPALFFFLLIEIIPFILGIYYSFTDWSPTKTSMMFVGLQNYISAIQSTQFQYSFGITVLYTLGSMILINVFSLTFAVLVTRKLRFTSVYRAGFFTPNLIGGLVLGFLWNFIFVKFIPPLLISLLHSGDVQTYSLLNTTVGRAMIALISVGSWQYIGYIMVIYVAALQNVPGDLIEASQIDGATRWQQFRNITMPMIAPAFTITLFLTMSNSFKQFDINYALTNGGPALDDIIKRGTSFISLDIVNTFNGTLSGQGAAVAQAKAIIFFLVLVGISLVQVIYNKRKEVEM